MNKCVVIRADASNRVGAGHFMRSVALAQEFQRRSISVRFVSVLQDESLKTYLRGQGFEATFLNLRDEELGTSKDVAAMLDVLGEEQTVVLDNDYFAESYQRQLRQRGCFLVVLDDSCERKFASDVVINHGYDAQKLEYDASGDTQYLLGLEFALIRRPLIRHGDERPKGQKNVLITMGGSQQPEAVSKILEGLQEFNQHPLHIRVLGAFADSEDAPKRQHGLHVIEAVPVVHDMRSVYEWADLAICAGGGTSWELCHFGIVGLIGALADQQIAVGKALASEGIFDYLGRYRDVSASDIKNKFEEIIRNKDELNKRRNRAMRLVDGRGCERVVDALIQLTTPFELNTNKN